MSDYGSLQNLMYGGAKNVINPEVGMGATEVMYTDREPYTIIEVSKSGKRFKMQRDEAIRKDKNGMSDAQDYEYKADPDGGITEVSLRTDGKWKIVGSTTVVLVGQRMKYYDYSF